MREVSERDHDFDAGASQLIARCVEIKLTFQMVHSSFQERFAVELAPQADGAELVTFGERLVGEISSDFLRREIDVGENDNASLRLLDDLSAPARLAAGIKTFAAVETHLLEDCDQVRERLAAGAVRVMIVIGPTKAEAILSFVLQPPGSVTVCPIL